MKLIIKYTLILLAIGLAGFALSGYLVKIPSQLGSVKMTLVVVPTLGLVLYQLWNAGVWSEVLAAMGLKVSRKGAMKVWLESESMKWLPGSVWSYGSRVVSAKKLGINKKQASASIVLELVLTNIAWGTLAITALFNAEMIALVKPYFIIIIKHSLILTLVVAFMAVAVILIRKVVMNMLKKLLEIKKVSASMAITTVAHYILLCLWNVVMMWLLILSIPNVDVSFFTLIGIAGIAWMAGFWAIGIPGGVGVREAVIVALLIHFGSLESAILVAILWRVIQMISEISALVISFIVKASKQVEIENNRNQSHEVSNAVS